MRMLNTFWPYVAMAGNGGSGLPCPVLGAPRGMPTVEGSTLRKRILVLLTAAALFMIPTGSASAAGGTGCPPNASLGDVPSGAEFLDRNGDGQLCWMKMKNGFNLLDNRVAAP